MAAPKDVSLTVLPDAEQPRPLPGRGGSRMERRRFAVLLLVQLLIIAHVVQWFVMGTTLAPIEPSESIQTVRGGVITVGFIFFVLAIGSTMILGRFFCGWGCHVMLLQDWCGRLLGRWGIRPRPFRSRLLRLLPLVLALYMFVWPVAHRFLIAPWIGEVPRWPGWSFEATTEQFWATFPGLLMAIPFLLVCGFLTVYLLGMKGYCTYACPYGGVFAPAEQLSPVRIRVDDNCEHCGQCTAACTSNVRVHEEVAAFGMVVDPGCMKCLDCVSTCPNDALHLGIGRPAISVGTEERTDARAAGTIRGSFDLSWTEEIVFAIIAVGILLSIRGAYSLPLLFASGVAACGTWIAWRSWRILRDPNASFHRFALKRSGRIRPAGIVIVLTGLLVLLSSAWIGSANFAAQVAVRHDDRVLVPPSMVFSRVGYIAPDGDMPEEAEKALEWYRRAGFVGDGGWSPLPSKRASFAIREAWLLSVLGRFDQALVMIDDVIAKIGLDEDLALARGRIMRMVDPASLDVAYGSMLDAHPDWMRLRDERVLWRLEEQTPASAIKEARVGLERHPDALLPMRRLAVLLVDHGGPSGWRESAEITRRTLEIEPENANAWRALALAIAKSGDLEAAEEAMSEAIALVPTDWRLRHQNAVLLNDLDRWDDADLELEESLRLWEIAGGETAGTRPSLRARPQGPMPPPSE